MTQSKQKEAFKVLEDALKSQTVAVSKRFTNEEIAEHLGQRRRGSVDSNLQAN